MRHIPRPLLVVAVSALLTGQSLLGLTASAATRPLPHSAPFHGAPFHSTSPHSTPPHSTPPHSTPRHSTLLHNGLPCIPATPCPNSSTSLDRTPGSRSPSRHPLSRPPPQPVRQPNPPKLRFTWPLAPPHPVLRPFEAPSSPYGPGHRGVDLGAPVDEPVLAAADGVIVFAGPLAGRGVVSVDHANGLRTTYEPVAPTVRAGQRVAGGAVLGHLRPGHARCTGAQACLHWGVRRGTEYLDPLTLMSNGRVRLLPWEGDADSE